MRVIFAGSAFPEDPGSGHGWEESLGWPAGWVAPAASVGVPCVLDWRLEFHLPTARTLRLHVSADERYLLRIDGRAMGEGPERCDLARWSYETYDVQLGPGPHRLEARTWNATPHAPWAQSTLGPALLVAPGAAADVHLVATGHAPWQVRPAAGLALVRADVGSGFGGGAAEAVDLRAAEAAWGAVRLTASAHEGFRLYSTRPDRLLRPALLPSQQHEPLTWRIVHADQAGLDERCVAGHSPPALPLRVDPGRRMRLVVDLGCYACHRPELEVAGDGTVRVRYLEAACADPVHPLDSKGRRDTVSGLFLRGMTDTVQAGSAPTAWSPMWWRAGRFVAIELQAGAGALALLQLGFASTGYPLPIEARWPDDAVAQACLRTLRRCMHETFVDCPYYEQLQYVGDTRIQALLTHALSRDVRPAVAALRHFAASALNPLCHPTSNHPAAGGQIIPPFALIVIGMAHDLLRWRGCLAELRRLMPVLRRTMEVLLVRDAAGLPVAPPGWNFFDGEHDLHRDGVPPGCQAGGNGACWGWLVVLACGWLADLETALAESELSARWRRLAVELAQAVHTATWDGAGWRFAPGHAERSPHAAVLALLAHAAPSADLARGAEALFADPAQMRFGIMFSHYLFEVAAERGCLDAVRPLWRRWEASLADGFTTTPESWGRTRSDCHAWGAHPLFWRLAGVAGIRPAADAFARVLIAPQLAEGESISVAMPHPEGGEISVELCCQGGRLSGRVHSPVPGILRWQGEDMRLMAGGQQVLP